MKHELDLTFNLEEQSRCEHMAINNSNLYCFYWKEYYNMVQIRSIKHLDQEPLDLKTSTFGRRYKVLIDNAMFAIFIFKQVSGTGFEILKIDKQNKFYSQIYIRSADLGAFNLFVTDFMVYFNTESNILSLILVNSMNHTLNIYTAFFNVKSMELQKIKTINDSFDLYPLDPTIWGIKCDTKV
jgi:hypothetical protein